MREIYGDLWAQTGTICIPTNGTITTGNRLVMGKGMALQLKQDYPDIDLYLGMFVRAFGNRVFPLCGQDGRPTIFTFPTKDDWRYKSTLYRIVQSCHQLIDLTDRFKLLEVYLPRVGCGLGGLDWKKEVFPLLNEQLDNRFIIVHDKISEANQILS